MSKTSRFVATALFVIILCAMAVPAYATGGIEPVSPEQMGDKLNTVSNGLYSACSPITDIIGKLSLGGAGLFLMLFFIFGKGGMGKAIGAAVAVVFGLMLWYSAPYIVGLIKSLSF